MNLSLANVQQIVSRSLRKLRTLLDRSRGAGPSRQQPSAIGGRRVSPTDESVAILTVVSGPRMSRRVDAAALSIRAPVGTIVLYLAIDGGGYDIVVRSQVGVVVWWVVLIGAASGLCPRAA